MLDQKEGERVIKLLKEKELTCRPAEFDNDPQFLNCAGLAVNLATGESRPTVRDDRFMRTTAAGPRK